MPQHDKTLFNDPFIVTGVAGFIGSHVAKALVSQGVEVIGIDDFSNGKRENVPTDVTFIEGDLALPATMDKLPNRADAILHLAGQSSGEISFDDPLADLQKNTHSTLNLIRYGIRAQAQRLVYASSMSVYGDVSDRPIDEHHPCRPLTCYGCSKLASETYLNVYRAELPFIALRMFNVYGPGQDMANMRQGMVSIFLSQALDGRSILVKGSAERFRDFIYIDDVVEAWLSACIQDTQDNLILNLGTGVRTEVSNLLDEIARQVPGSNWYSEGGTPGDQRGIFSDMTLFERQFGFRPSTTLTNGIKRFTEWARGSLDHD